jgi:hypothetical protein
MAMASSTSSVVRRTPPVAGLRAVDGTSGRTTAAFDFSVRTLLLERSLIQSFASWTSLVDSRKSHGSSLMKSDRRAVRVLAFRETSDDGLTQALAARTSSSSSMRADPSIRAASGASTPRYLTSPCRRIHAVAAVSGPPAAARLSDVVMVDRRTARSWASLSSSSVTSNGLGGRSRTVRSTLASCSRVAGESVATSSANRSAASSLARPTRGTAARIGDIDSVVPWGAAGEDVHHAQAVPQGVPPERDRGGSRS